MLCYLTVNVYFYRFCDHWRFVSQRFAFLGAFIVYLESDRLITRPELAEMLGGTVYESRKCAIFVDHVSVIVLIVEYQVITFAAFKLG